MKNTLKKLISLSFITIPLVALSAATSTPKGEFNKEQEQDIARIVKDTLITHPEILMQAAQALQEKQQKEEIDRAITAIKKDLKRVFNDPKTPTTKNKNTTVDLVEFFDYQCGHCKAMAPIIQNLHKSHPEIKFIFKELPIFGGASKYAAEAALAASLQPQKYYAFHNALFTATEPLTEKSILDIAKKTNIDTKKLLKDIKQPWIDQQIKDNFALSQSLKISGTPAFIISNADHTTFSFIPGSTSQAELTKEVEKASR